MQIGDVVRVRVMARCYLARIDKANPRVRVTFVSHVPPIDGRRKRSRYFPKREIQPYGKGGVDWPIKKRLSRD